MDKYLEAARRGLLIEKRPSRRYNRCRGCDALHGVRMHAWELKAPEGRALVAQEPLLRPVTSTTPVTVLFCDSCSDRLRAVQSGS